MCVSFLSEIDSRLDGGPPQQTVKEENFKKLNKKFGLTIK